MRKTMARLAALIGTTATALALAAPASAWYGDVSASASTRVAVDAFGPGVPAGFAEYANDFAEAGAAGTASASYRWPPPPFDFTRAYLACGDPSGCVSGDARAYAAVDRPQGKLRAVAAGSIATSGGNAGLNQTQGVAEISDTITLSEPATVLLEGAIDGKLGFSHSHDGWYGDPRGRLRASISFTGYDEDAGEWPYVSLGGFNEEYSADAVFRCPYPATCAVTGDMTLGPQVVSDTFSVEVELPAGTSYFSASLAASVDMMVWGTQGDAYRSQHAASALVDFGNTATFRIVVPEGVVATSGSGQLPLVGGSGGDPQDTDAPEISCDAPPTGWQAADVAIACAASDAGSGLADAADASFTLTTSVPAGDETAGAATGSREVCDAAGNCATAGPFAGLKV
ncbi:MAG TPA: hypothetical protein VM290_00095, partial [Gaiellaceae bacterium]|nr:hypothetical protein [Gaiellaceae bacterium]